MALSIKTTAHFRKDVKIAEKRGLDISLLRDVLMVLASQKPLPPERRDHALTGKYAGFRECHIRPDWLLIYAIDGNRLILTASRGSHSDLF